MAINLTPYALGTDDGEALWFFGMLVTIKASAEQTNGEFLLLEELAPRGTATPLHVHPQDDESFFVLEGEMTFYLEDGQPIPASAGAFIHIPKGHVPHAFYVESEMARFLVLTRPLHERFIRAAAEPAQSRTLPPPAAPDMEKVMAAAREAGMEFLGPPPGPRGHIRPPRTTFETSSSYHVPRPRKFSPEQEAAIRSEAGNRTLRDLAAAFGGKP
jgi:quercetin dioxygenase-like cupin family protein